MGVCNSLLSEKTLVKTTVLATDIEIPKIRPEVQDHPRSLINIVEMIVQFAI